MIASARALVFVVATFFFAFAVNAQEGAVATTATHDLDIQLTLTDVGPGFNSNANDILEAGESGALKFLVINYGQAPSPDINLLMSSSFAPLDGLYVELPGLESGEGVEFETQLDLPPGTDLTLVDLAAEIFDAENNPLADKFEWKIVNGALIAATDAAYAAVTATAYAAMATSPGTIKGVVIDIETGSGLAAGIIVRETKTLVEADANGYFAIPVSAGIYTLSFNFKDKRERIIEGIRVEGGASTVVDIVLEPRDSSIAGMRGAGSVQEVVVQTRADRSKASVQLVIRQKAAVVSDRLSGEEMSRAAAGTAAKAVQRAVGTTLVGGKYVYVRGLGERYSYTMLNGAKLPSPEPNQKVVPLDIFPTAVIADVAILKTAAPNIPGDFAGGAVRVQTKEFPDERECSVGLSLGYLASATAKGILTYRGGKTDWLGLDDGKRAFPNTVPGNSRLFEGATFGNRQLSRDEMTAIAREFNNDYSLHRRAAPPDMDGSLVCGDTVKLAGRPFGYLASFKFGNGFEREFQVRRRYSLTSDESGQRTLTAATDYDGETGIQSSKSSILANLNYSLANGHALDIVALMTSASVDEARFYEGRDDSSGGDLQYTSLRFVRRTLFFNQLSGKHDFGSAIFGWRANYSLALRDEPDWRELVRTSPEGNDSFKWWPKSSSGSHYWSELREPAFGAGAEANIPFLQWSGLAGSAEFGSLISARDRSFDVRRLRFLPLSGSDPQHGALDPELLFADDQIGTNVRLEENSRTTDNYEAKERTYAAYAMVDLPVVEPLRFVGGARYERSEISVTTFDAFAPVVASLDSGLKNDDVLPSLNAVYELRKDVVLRAGAAQTVARPDFRELSPFALSDFYGGQELVGNPDLKRTRIWNADLRAEWYPSEGEVAAVSAFFKSFDDPIEQVIIASQQQFISYENADGATNYGFEVEFRRNLGFISPTLRPIYGGGNMTWLKSRVALDPDSGVQTRSDRPLQGQSDMLGNVIAGLDFDLKYVVQFSYNVASKRIAQVGAFGLPDIFELPFHSLNLTYQQRLSDRMSFGVTLENILDEPSVFEQDGLLVARDYQGISGSLGFEFEF